MAANDLFFFFLLGVFISGIRNSLSEFSAQLCLKCPTTNRWPEISWFIYTAQVS